MSRMLIARMCDLAHELSRGQDRVVVGRVADMAYLLRQSAGELKGSLANL